MTVTLLYAAHRPYVRGVVRRLGVDAPDVDDLTHEVFCVLLRRPLAETEPRGLRRWLYQTARRVVSNHRRARRREALRRAQAWVPPAPACPEAAAMEQQARRRLDRAIAELPAETRALHHLSEVEELPGPEVAQRLGINPNTAYARVRALRRRLAQVLLVLAIVLASIAARMGCEVGSTSSDSLTVSQASAGGRSSDDRADAPGRAPLRGPALGLVVLADRR